MIHFINVSKILSNIDGRKTLILEPTTLSIPTNSKVGILYEEGKPNSELLELVVGALPVTEGRIVRSARLSPPMPLKALFHPKLSGQDNIAFIARIYGEDIDKTVDLVDKFSELGSDLERPVKSYSNDMKVRLGISICFSIPFDCYLSEHAFLVGPKWFQEKCTEYLQREGANVGLLLFSSQVSQLQKYCEFFLVYRNHRLIPMASLDGVR